MGKKNLTKEEFIERAKKIHGDKYNYFKTEYINYKTKICIICPEHGEFWQTPNAHLRGQGCPKCYGNYKLTYDEFLKRAKKIHGNKYDYSKVSFKNVMEKVCIICPEHGEFWQTPKVHLKSVDGCPKCTNKKNGFNKRLTKDDFIKKCKKIHGEKYDYSKIEYINTEEKVCIICPEHGEFWQTPHNHTSQKQGCPYCTSSHLENEITLLLCENNINYIREKKFEWLKYKKKLSLDFYLFDKNIAIECQGEQHFTKFRWEKNEDKLKERQFRDKIKKELCEKHGIKLIYYSYKKFNDDIITDKNKIIEIIQ